MTASKRAAYKARTSVRVINKELRQAEIRFPDGACVQVWLVAGAVRIFGGDVLTKEEAAIAEEKIRATFPEREQRSLFG